MRSASYIFSLQAFSSANPQSVLSIPLSASGAAELKNIAMLDAVDSWYSGVVSLAQAARGVHDLRFGWATVKLYYSAFYFVRCGLLAEGWCQFYVQKKPRAIWARAGALAERLTGTSHESCFDLYGRVFPNSSLITQPIGVDPAIEWLKSRREQVNYIDARFPDPACPSWFQMHVSSGVREMLSTYLSDHFTYASLPDHAMIAYPLAAAVVASEQLRALGVTVDRECVNGFRSYWRDGKGQFPGFEKLVP